MSEVLEVTRSAQGVEQQIRALDSRLESLHTRRKAAEAELNRLSKEENRLIRLFAIADGKEKHSIRSKVDLVARERSDREKDVSGLAAAISEVEQERATLVPAFEAAWKLRNEHQRKAKLRELWQDHEENLIKVRDCDKALQDARAAADRSFFAWTTLKDQEFLNEQLAATERFKASWQQQSGPNAPGNRK